MDATNFCLLKAVVIVVDYDANARTMLSDPNLNFFGSVATHVRRGVDPDGDTVAIKCPHEFRCQVISQPPRGCQHDDTSGFILDPLQLPQMRLAQPICT
nr:hypothetical protein [Planctopirus ephydatiae]